MTTNPLDTLRQRFGANLAHPLNYDDVEALAQRLRADLAIVEVALAQLRTDEIARLEARLSELRGGPRGRPVMDPCPFCGRESFHNRAGRSSHLRTCPQNPDARPVASGRSSAGLGAGYSPLVEHLSEEALAALAEASLNVEQSDHRTYLRYQKDRMTIRERLGDVTDLASVTAAQIRAAAGRLHARHAAKLAERTAARNGHTEEALPK